MKIFFKLVSISLLIPFFVYLSIPLNSFPKPPSDAVQSMEDADIETPFRRAYFTDFTREELIKHYKEQLGFPISLPLPLRLNYPPEDAQTLIRDQTRSTFLEELVFPFRESLFINGFEPKEAKDDIWYKGQHFRQKIIIRHIPSSVYWRIIIGVLVAISAFILIQSLCKFWIGLIRREI